MSGPSDATKKRLFAVSSNQCAFPNCRNPLVDSSGKVTGRICHVRGNRPGAPRHDPTQSDDERHGFDNLLLMCPIHHDVIDSDPESYTVARLLEIKLSHEQSHENDPELSQQIVNLFIQNVATGNNVHGSLIYTNQQMGGQVAHSITNIGPQPRRLSDAAARMMIEALQQQPPLESRVSALLGDGESFRFAAQVHETLRAAGWTVDGVNQAVYVPIPEGVIIRINSISPAVQVFGNLLVHAGIKARGEVNAQTEMAEVIVGSAI